MVAELPHKQIAKSEQDLLDIPALNLPSHSRYSFIDHERMEG